MKMNIRKLIEAATLSLLLCVFAGSALAQSGERESEALQVRSMTVDGVLVNENIVVLDGQRFRWPSPQRGRATSTDDESGVDLGDLPELSELEPGMRLNVVFEASDYRVPTILRVGLDQ